MAFIDEITSLDDGGNCVGLKYLDFFAHFDDHSIEKTGMTESQHRAH